MAMKKQPRRPKKEYPTTLEPHPYSLLIPEATDEEFQALKSDIAENGLQERISLYQGKILDGRHRYRACIELEIEPDLMPLDDDLTDKKAKSLVISMNVKRRHLTAGQKAMIAAEMVTTDEKGGRPKNRAKMHGFDQEITTDEASEMMNVSPRSVKQARQVIEKASSSVVDAVKKGEVAVSDAASIVDKPKKVQDFAVKSVREAKKKAEETGKDNKVTLKKVAQVADNNPLLRGAKAGGGEVEWYTPPEMVDLAREAMGSIDVDPASNPTAQQWIDAGEYFTAETDGLAQEWNGNVWINPPYKTDLIRGFADKAVEEFKAGRMKQMCWLSPPNSTDANWCQGLFEISSAICFPNERTRFIASDGHAEGSAWSSMIIYVGKGSVKFDKAFSKIGVVWKRRVK